MISKSEIASLVVGARLCWQYSETFARVLRIEQISERGIDGKGRAFARVVSGSLALRVTEGDLSIRIMRGHS